MNYVEYLRSHMGHEAVILNGTSVIILNDKEEVLLQKRTYPEKNWGLPGGLMEMGESLKETGIREVLEETGLLVKDLRLFKVYSGRGFYMELPNKDKFYLVNAVYVTKKYSGKMEVDEVEGSKLEFFSLENLPEYMVMSHKKFLTDYLEYKKK